MSYRSERKLLIDLPMIFTKTFDDKRVRNVLRPILSNSSFKRQYGQAVIDRIVERTQSSKDKNGNNMTSNAPYSKSYKNSDQFKIYGKSSKVDLTLTGEMLSSLISKNNSGPYITIEFDNELDAAKATGHITGNLGGNKAPIRDFFGLPMNDLTKLMKEEIKLFRSGSLELLADSGIPTLPAISFGFGDDT